MRSLRTWTAVLASSVAALAVPRPAAATGEPAPGGLTASTLRLPDGPGSVRGLADTPSVEPFTGQVRYGVPLELPRAVNGFAPDVALTYAGEVGNGPVGIGWTLPWAAVRRSLRQGVPSYDAGDELELVGIDGGGRLVPAGDGSYRVAGRGHALRVEVSAGGFLVTDAAGRRYKLGQSAATRQASGSRVAAWLLEEVTDLGGQRIRYDYKADRGDVYLHHISWGPDEVYRLEVSHAERPDRVVSYRTGARVETALRVDVIEVKSFGQRLRRYELGYQDDLPLSRLGSVRMLGKRGTSDALPLLSFGYAPEEPAVLAEVSGADGWMLYQQGVSFADVDGDGLGDLLRIDGDSHEVRRNRGGWFEAGRTLSGAPPVHLNEVQLMDLDGDVRPEMVLQVDGAWLPYYLVGDGWQAGDAYPGSQGVPFRGPATELADLNGDGRTDSLEAIGEGMYVRLNGPDGLDEGVLVPPISASSSDVQPGLPNVRFRDVNGDGLADVVWLMDGWMTMFLGRGDGTFVEHLTQAYPWGDQDFDLNDVQLIDLNRDGLLDLVRFASGYAEWYRGLANQGFEVVPRLLAPPHEDDGSVSIGVADVNGNGSDDLVWSSAGGMWVLDLAGPTSAGMLTSIHNGMGKHVTIAYEGSARLAAIAEAAGHAWASLLPVSIPVTTAMIVDVGSGPARRIDYLPRDGFWDRVEHSFGGFLRSTVTAPGDGPATTLVEETDYHPGLGGERVLRGVPVEARRSTGDGQLLEVTTHAWVAHTVAGLPADKPLLRIPVMTSRRTRHHGSDGTYVETLSAYTPDDEGRIVAETDHGRLDLSGDERTTTRRYTSDALTWVRDALVEERIVEGVVATAPALSHVRHYYGSEIGEALPLGQIGKGWLRRSEGWLAETTDGRWVELARKRYDVVGNPIEVTDAGITRSLGYDALRLFAISESVTPSPGKTLTWALAWDEVLGLAQRSTDPDGVQSSVEYDGLGRPRALQVGGHEPHVRFVYDWESGRPRTTTYHWDGELDDVPAVAAGASPGAGWRETVSVTDGSGDALFAATRLASQRWIVSGWRERNRRGQVVRSADPFEWTGANLPVALPGAAAAQTLHYDAKGRVVRQTLPSGLEKTVEYRPFEQTVRAPDLAPVTSRTDGLGRIVRTERLLAAGSERVDGSYDALGRVRSLSLQSGRAVHQFRYDTLGRLIFAHDPDVGVRRYRYDDGGRLVEAENGAAQHTQFSYDGAGRLVRRAAGSVSYDFHYDERAAGGGFLGGRLARIDEPDGSVEVAYDLLGREIQRKRTILGVSLDQRATLSASGLLLRSQIDDFVLDRVYDRAGRVVGVGDLWHADALDPAGRALSERFGNQLAQTTARDDLGFARRITLGLPGAAPLYDVSVTRNGYGALLGAVDHDLAGLDHTASFQYDDAARLVDATVGSGNQAFHFGYAYDGLQNMVSRSATGPRDIGVLAGDYGYAEDGAGPRQLTSVRAPGGGLTEMAYDGAGRVVRLGDKQLAYDSFDRLVRVEGATPGVPIVEHGYGADGVRSWTRRADGTLERRFGPDVEDVGGVRSIYVRVGDRVVARLTRPVAATATADAALASLAPTVGRGLWLVLALLLLPLALRRARPMLRLQRAVSALLVVLLAQAGCGPGSTGSAGPRSALGLGQVTFLHEAFAPGPMLITGADGHVVEERRYEPFGQPIDATLAEPMNGLNGHTDAATGWSDHGARFVAPELGRWLTPDPPARAPSAHFMAMPWDLHPYQYVRQNPVVFWDPDGQRGAQKQFRVIIVDDDGLLSDEMLEAVRARVEADLDEIAAESTNRTLRKGFVVEIHKGPMTRQEIRKLTKYDFAVHLMGDTSEPAANRVFKQHWGSRPSRANKDSISDALDNGGGWSFTTTGRKANGKKSVMFVGVSQYLDKVADGSLTETQAGTRIAEMSLHELTHPMIGKGNSAHDADGIFAAVLDTYEGEKIDAGTQEKIRKRLEKTAR